MNVDQKIKRVLAMQETNMALATIGDLTGHLLEATRILGEIEEKVHNDEELRQLKVGYSRGELPTFRDELGCRLFRAYQLLDTVSGMFHDLRGEIENHSDPKILERWKAALAKAGTVIADEDERDEQESAAAEKISDQEADEILDELDKLKDDRRHCH